MLVVLANRTNLTPDTLKMIFYTWSASNASVFSMSAVVTPPSGEGTLRNGRLVTRALEIVHPNQPVSSRECSSSNVKKTNNSQLTLSQPWAYYIIIYTYIYAQSLHKSIRIYIYSYIIYINFCLYKEMPMASKGF